jgi:hypothetical protein
VYEIDGKYYVVYEVPVDADGDGEFDEIIPIAYEATKEELVEAGLLDSAGLIMGLIGNNQYTPEEWESMGGLIVGNIKELNNSDDDPFEFLVSQLTDQANLYPWLLDPEVMALTAAAWLEGRSLTEGELAGTEFWQNTTQSMRNWMALNAQSPSEASQLLRDNRIMVLEMMQQAGINNAPDVLVNLIGDKFTTGLWTQTYLANQIDLLADPTKRGELDQDLKTYFEQHEGFELDTTKTYRDTVDATVRRWLGPAFGQWTEQQISEWAGRLRNDPDAKQELEKMLSQQRMSIFSAYTDPTQTYDDIASPWRNHVMNLWGEIPDETDEFFQNIVKMNDIVEASAQLREEGVKRGIGKITESMLDDLSTGFGDSIVRIAR